MTKRFGIIGFGVVGKSILQYYAQSPLRFSQTLSSLTGMPLAEDEIWHVDVCDKRILTPSECEFIKASGAQYTGAPCEEVAAAVDYAWVAAGIDIPALGIDEHKLITEIDLFAALWHKKIVAVTGTTGKTSLTQLLVELFSLDSCASKLYSIYSSGACTHYSGCSYQRMAPGGNIGVGLLDLVPHAEVLHGTVVELSSWQLEYGKSCVADFAIWTNLYENHLDRHKTMENYFAAKSRLLEMQKPTGKALVGASLIAPEIRPYFARHRPQWPGEIVMLFCQKPTESEYLFAREQRLSMMYPLNDMMMFERPESSAEIVFPCEALPLVGFIDTWLYALGALHLLGVNIMQFSYDALSKAYTQALAKIGAHRLEFCGKKRGAFFYNDSKSTIMQTTQAAVNKISQQSKNIIVIVGGIGKGVDRAPLVTFLNNHPAIKKVIRVGTACDDLAPLPHFETLEAAMNHIISELEVGDVVLFSPGGASFDLYQNYSQRGDAFKEMVALL